MSEEPQPLSLGERIEKWRKHRGLSQRQLAQRAGVDHAWISRLESGERTNINVWILRRIARVLGVGIDYLVNTFNGETDDPTVSPQAVFATVESETPLAVATLLEEGS